MSESESDVAALLGESFPSSGSGAGVLEARRGRREGTVSVGSRRLRWCRPESRAVILGSTQPDAAVDRDRAAAAGLEVERRATGGGAVLVGPDDLLWAEVLLPPLDPLWEPDVGRSAWWLGQTWATALAELLPDIESGEVEVHRGSMVRTAWSDNVCFSGLAPGEVHIGGRKVVGIAQRRGRWGSLLQCAALLSWEPVTLLDVLALAPERREGGRAELEEAARPAGVDPEALVEAFARNLP